jgi:tetratricopeptide (TPR) repeat protein
MRQLAGQLALIAGDFASAIQHFEALIRLSKEGKAVEELPDVYARYAMALLALNRNVRAVDAMAEAVPQQPESLEQIWGHHLRLGLRSDDIERRDAYARQMLEVLYDLSDRLPDHPGVESRIGNTYLFKHNFSDAIAAFERAAALAEEHPRPAIWLTTEFFFDWGNALERSGRIEEAVTVFNRVLTLNPNHHQTLNYLAYMWAERGENLDQAMEYIEKALEETPNNGSYIDTLGWIHYQRGELEPARAALQTAADLEPMEPVILEHLADTLLALNQPLQAAGYYRIALEMEEQEPEQHHRIQVRLQQAMDAVTAGIQAP